MQSITQDLTFTGGMSYPRPQVQGGTQPCAYRKHKKVRSPMMNLGDELGPRDMPCARSVVGSAISSQRSCVYRAAVLEAQAETQCALAGLASPRAECNEQHQAITSNILAVQQSVQEGLQVSEQLRTARNQQGVRVEAMGHRLGVMNGLLLQRELSVETQIYDLSNPMNSVLSALDILRQEQSLPRTSGEAMKVGNFSASISVKPVGGSSVGIPVKPDNVERNSAEVPKPSTARPPKLLPGVRTEQLMLSVPDCERKPARVQIKGPHDSSSTMQSIVTGTRGQGVDPITIYLDFSTEVDLSHSKATLGSQTDEAAYKSAQTILSGPSSLYLTTDNGMPSGNPCASSTRKKEQETMDVKDLSIGATQGSQDATHDPEPTKDVEISPEQLRFTAAISKAMSKEFAPLMAGRDLEQARPSVYRGSKDGSIDGWILVLRRYLKRTQFKVSLDDQAWSITGHLEGEARNYIINKAEYKRDTLEKVFELLSSRFGAGGI